MIEKINEFADDCNETTGASFTMSKLKSGEWKVSFPNQGQHFSHADLMEAIEGAHDWLISKRRPVEIETKYTLYTRG